MKKISFDFLATMPLKEIDKSPSNVTGGKTPANGADFRLFSDGSIYPSSARITSDNLEFQNKDSGAAEFGYDIFMSTDWGQFNSDVKFPCIAKVSKHLDKVNLFGRTKYNVDGTPKSSILNLKTTQGDELITYLEEAYCDKDAGETLFANKTYVDLKINFNTPLQETATKIYNIPKRVMRGKDAGKLGYIRRENIIIYPISVVENGSHVAAAVSVTTAPVAQTVVSAPAPSAVPADIAEKVFG